jgi:MFS family permease
LKAIVAGLLPEGKRGLAFGVFYTGYGTAWLVGGVLTGLLYERSKLIVVIFAVAIQCASIPWFLLASRTERHAH